MAVTNNSDTNNNVDNSVNTTTSKNSVGAPNGRNNGRKEAVETPQMNVLGRDGNDFELSVHDDVASLPGNGSMHSPTRRVSSSLPSSPTNFPRKKGGRVGVSHASIPQSETQTTTTNNNATTTSVGKRSWWGKMTKWSSVPTDNIDSVPSHESDYQSLDNKPDETNDTTLNNNNCAAVHTDPSAGGGMGRRRNNHRDNIHNHQQQQQGSPTVEDQLRQDCAFFYRGFDEDQAPPERRARNPLLNVTLTDRVPRVISRDGAMFRARYERLNQDIIVDNDLQLSEQPDVICFDSTCSRNVLDVNNSSLFYEQDGKILLRLPRDQVRLVVDDDMEAGIIAVEQWRQGNGTASTAAAAAAPTLSTTNGDRPKTFAETNPPLRYVMSAPDDLYRRVVSEMSDALTPRWFGLSKCCHDDERADISVALAILAVIFLLMFISTLYWPTD